MGEKQRLAWDRKYSLQGPVWARSHDDWFEIGEAERVLDLGCGTGKSCNSLGGHLVAADFSMVALRTLRDSIEDVDTVCCESSGLPFKGSSFDFIRTSFLFGHLDESERVSTMNEISRVLREGGRLALEVFSTSDARCVRNGKTVRLTEGGIFHCYFDEKDIIDLLSGFKIINLAEENWEQRIGPGEKMERSIIRASAIKN